MEPVREHDRVPAAVTARALFDYQHMFGLDEPALLAGEMLDCPAGASPFGAQVRARGGTVTSVDPVYDQPVGEILALVADNLGHAPEWLAAHSDSIDWSYLGSADAHIRASQVGADLFATDYVASPQHYVSALLPQLPFPDRYFALTLSAHLLFVNARLSLSGHLDALRELVRVTHGEVRVHPLVEPTGVCSPHLDQIRQSLAEHGIGTELRPVEKGWILGGDHTLICHPPR